MTFIELQETKTDYLIYIDINQIEMLTIIVVNKGTDYESENTIVHLKSGKQIEVYESIEQILGIIGGKVIF